MQGARKSCPPSHSSVSLSSAYVFFILFLGGPYCPRSSVTVPSFLKFSGGYPLCSPGVIPSLHASSFDFFLKGSRTSQWPHVSLSISKLSVPPFCVLFPQPGFNFPCAPFPFSLRFSFFPPACSHPADLLSPKTGLLAWRLRPCCVTVVL